MDLGLVARRQSFAPSSRGLGRACAEALAPKGFVSLLMASTPMRSRMLHELRNSWSEVEAVVADVTTDVGRDALLSAAPEPDILINNAGGPPAGNFRDWTRDDWIKALDANMLSAIEMIKRTIDPMIERRFGRIVNITSGAVKAPFPYLGLSNGARSGLTGFRGGSCARGFGSQCDLNNFCLGRLRPTALPRPPAPSPRACGH